MHFINFIPFFRQQMNLSLRKYYTRTIQAMFTRCYSSRREEVKRYLERQADDQYSRRAKEHSYRARSAFKLLQINEKFRFIKPGIVAVDIGASPGSWCQVLSELIFPNANDSGNMRQNLSKPIWKQQQSATCTGYILGVDLLAIAPIQNVDLLSKADITKMATQLEIKRRLDGRRVDLLVSDMAPNPTGDSPTDHMRILQLCRILLQFCTDHGPNEQPILADGAIFLCKIFDGPYRDEFITQLKEQFRVAKIVKPNASRDSSSETYIFASGFKKRI